MTNFKLYELSAAYDLHNVKSLVDAREKMQHEFFSSESDCRYVDKNFTVILVLPHKINITAYEMFEKFAKTFRNVEKAARFTYKLCCMINEAELKGENRCDISDLFKYNETGYSAHSLFIKIYNESDLFICIEEKATPVEPETETEFRFIPRPKVEGYTEDYSYIVMF